MLGDNCENGSLYVQLIVSSPPVGHARTILKQMIAHFHPVQLQAISTIRGHSWSEPLRMRTQTICIVTSMYKEVRTLAATEA